MTQPEGGVVHGEDFSRSGVAGHLGGLFGGGVGGDVGVVGADADVPPLVVVLRVAEAERLVARQREASRKPGP